ncbi:4-hydroxythreonine-4-phosphate dehydrogenase PdxA [bacterium]|nr:MAG: 4-hydroxythreonine-4-phosphate dehydrogenase PdxA [bacterium]
MIRVVISCGDPAGIGYEIVMKSLIRYSPSDVQFSLCCAPSVFESVAHIIPQSEKFFDLIKSNIVKLISVSNDSDFITGRIDMKCGRVAYDSFITAVDKVISEQCDAIVTAPVSKKAIRLSGIEFTGHTEILGEKFRCPITMMLFAKDFRVALVTTHIPLKKVPEFIRSENIFGHIQRLHSALKNWFGINEPKIAVLGLNPHSGESGTIGDEETEIEDAISRAIGLGIQIDGPLVPDVAFLPSQREKYDAYLTMYHDQGSIPLKAFGFKFGVNITLGLPKPRTSPDHGTAFDIAGRGIADPESFIQALKTAIEICRKSN